MIKGSALYLSVIISLVITLICGSIILIAHTYNLQYKKQERMQRLQNNLSSGMTVIMDHNFPLDSAVNTSLFEITNDSIRLEKKRWGIYQVGLVKAWVNKDSLGKAFLLGFKLKDSLQVLFLADQGRPLTISGKTKIIGTAYLPQSGVKAGYVDTLGYTDKTLVYGLVKKSKQSLPELDRITLTYIRSLLTENIKSGSSQIIRVEAGGLANDDTTNSFFNPCLKVHLKKNASDLSSKSITGNVIVFSDTTITVGHDSKLDKAILIAPYVSIQPGFKGVVQVIASDSITLGNRVELSYPSALLLLKNDSAKHQVKIRIGKDCKIEGQLLAYQKDQEVLMPVIEIGAKTIIAGELYSTGYIALARSARVNGSLTASRFMARTSESIYENYLIDVKLDRLELSRYYLGTKLFNSDAIQSHVLCWLN